MYKNFETKIKDVDEKGRVLVVANAIGNIDSDKDMSMPGSFNKTLKEGFPRLKWLLNHNKDWLIGVPLEGKEENMQLQMLGQLNLDKQLGRDVYSDYKLYAEHNRSLEHSVGVEAIKKVQDKDHRKVQEWKLWEYSTLYTWGANEQTPALAIKSMDDLPDAIDWLELKLKKGNYSDERFKDIEKQLYILRSLCAEPDASTLVVKPNENGNTDNTAVAKKLNSILQHLNV